MVTFRVDDVTPASQALPTEPIGDRFADALVVGGDPALPALRPDGVHPLLSAVGRAFADHRPLVLSPDAVWLTIMHGLAQHVRLHAEELRPRLVGHEGRKRLTVEVGGPIPRDAGSWQDILESFGKLLLNEIGDARIERIAVERPEPYGPESLNPFRLADDPADVPVYGTSFALLLDAALDSGGDISHLQTGRLDELEGPAD